jgi:hypothetical protein
MTTPAAHIATAIADACDIDYSSTYRPPTVLAKSVFVTPASTWKETGDRFVGHSIGLVAFISVGLADQEQALEWLDAQTTILIDLAPIDLDHADDVHVESIEEPKVFENMDGTQLLTCRITFTRFTSED